MDTYEQLIEKVNVLKLREAEMTARIQEQEELIVSLQTSEQHSAVLSAIVTSTDDAIISKDLNSIITSWNSSAERIFGYSAEEMIGQSILKLIPQDRQGEEPMILGKLKSGKRVDHFETKRLTKNGQLIDVSLSLSPVKNAEGKIVGLSKIARDITDKKLEEQRKNDFIAIVSHELKTPLTSVKSYIQLALRKAKGRADDFSENILSRADAQTRKMTDMIHNFLNLSRLEEGKMALSLSHFSLKQLMDETVQEGLVLAPNHVIVYHGCPEFELYGDREKISQVTINLLNNAVKYSKTGSSITIDCLLNDGQIKISFTDEGVGIRKEDQIHLFERFYRVNNDQIKHISGFGIGLYLVAEILKLHGSEIKVESNLGNGSVFFFSLKAHESIE
jgi:two-component system sensor histidine kinase VicK